MKDTVVIQRERSRPHKEKQGIEPASRPRRRTILIAAAIVIALVLIGLAVGLGVGLGTRDNSDDTTPTTTSDEPPLPSPSHLTSWQPATNASWQIVLANPLALDDSATSITPNVDIFDIDMFTNSNDTFAALHNLGKKVICYFSAGSYEPNRPDSLQFDKSTDLGKELDGWPGEYWLNLSSPNVRNIMAARIQLAADKGCDAIDPDNVDGYANDNGLGQTQENSINFIQFLSLQAVQHNVSMGLKNANALIPQVLNLVQFSVNEQCVQYSECTAFTPFIQASKPVFHIEYPDNAPKISQSDLDTDCSTDGAGAGSFDFSTVLKTMDLDGFVEYCNGNSETTPLNTR